MPLSFGFGKGTSALNSDKFWSPLQLSPSVWLDAQDSASVVLTSGVVSQWSDKSGNNRHATQGTAANMPTYSDTSIKSRHIVFDGVNDSLNVTSWGTISQPFTRVIVFSPITIGSSGNKFLLESVAATASTDVGDYFVSNQNKINAYAGVVGTSVDCVANTTYIRIATYNTTSGTQHTNGTGNGTYNLGTNSQSGLAIGWDGSGNSSWTNVKVYEVIFIPRVLTESERQRLEGYLAEKWNLQSSLPANHPYKSSKPKMEVSPNSFSGLRVWFKADAGVKDASGNKISSDGTTIATWEDQSGNGFHAIQSVDASRPTWSSPANATGKDLPGINFDGTNRWLERRETLFTSAVSYFVVCKWADTTGRYWPVDVAGYYPYHFALEQHSSPNRIAFFGANNSWVTSMTPTSGMQMFSILANTVSGATININTDVKFRRNKTTLSLSVNVQNGTTWPDYSIANAKGFSIGRPTTLGALNMKGQVYEIIVYNRVLSDFERDEIENYLSRKWKI